MFKKLSTRMLLFILTPTILFILGLTIYISYTVHDIAIKDAEIQLETHGELLARELGLELERALVSVENLSKSFEAMIENRAADRENAITMLKNDQHPYILTAWMYWEKMLLTAEIQNLSMLGDMIIQVSLFHFGLETNLAI